MKYTNNEYSYPYHKSTHLKLASTILRPLTLSAAVIVVIIPLVIFGVMSLQNGNNCRELSARFSKRFNEFNSGIVELAASETVSEYLAGGDNSTDVYRLLYDFRNSTSPYSEFQLTSGDGSLFIGNDSFGGSTVYRSSNDVRLKIRLTAVSGVVEHRIITHYSVNQPIYSLNCQIEDGSLLSFLFTARSFDSLFYSAGSIITNEYNHTIYARELSGAANTEQTFEANHFLLNIYKYNNRFVILNRSPIEGTMMTAYTVSPIDSLLSILQIEILVLVLVLGLTALFVYRSGFVVTTITMAPMDSFVKALERFDDGDTSYRIPASGDPDTQEYVDQFNKLLCDITRLLEKNKELTEQTRKFEVRLLLSQFNPHFMFNMLDNIKYTVSDDPEKARSMVISLSHMLRYTLDNINETEATLARDLSYIEDYLALQKIRLGPLFSYSISIADQSLLNVKLPKLIMQPSIENSVSHGFRCDRPFHIDVSIERAGDCMLVTIADNGSGLTDESLARIRKRLDRGTTSSEHIGLLNTHRRLKLLYGKGYGVSVESNDKGGVTTKLKIKLGDNHV